jgi:autotransporter-associated beta strand protein
VLAALVHGGTLFAQSVRTWESAPVSGDWNTAGNWNPPDVPDAPNETALFGASTVTGVSLSGDVFLDHLEFGASAPAYVLHTAGHRFYLQAGGVVNASALRQEVDVNGGTFAVFQGETAQTRITISGMAQTQFDGTSSAADAIITVANSLGQGGLFFHNTATAARATILNQGLTQFIEASSAGSATITNQSELTFFSTSTGADATIITQAGARTSFVEGSNGGNARLVLVNGGLVSFDFNTRGEVSAGSIEGNGQITLGSNNLTVGSNNLSTDFPGGLSGTGRLTKIGTGTLTLTGDNSYTGGTLIAGGVLAISRDANLGPPGSALDLDGGTLRLLGSISMNRPSTLGAGGGAIDTNGFDLSFARGFTGAGGLTKLGPGTLTLRGVNTYLGGTKVLGGTLVVDFLVLGSVQVGQVGFIAPNVPTLAGSGLIGVDLLNFSGIVSPGNSPGTLHVAGNYVQLPQGVLRIEIAGRAASEFDHLEVSGRARLDGTVRFVTLGNFRPRGGDRFEFLTAAGGVNGRFSTIVLDRPLLAGRVVYTGNTAALTFSRLPIVPVFAAAADAQPIPALTPNQKAVAQSLDSALEDRRLDRVFSRLDRLTLGGVPGALDRIAPEELSAMYEVAIGTANVQAFNLDRHLGDVRAGARGFSGDRLSLSGIGDKSLRGADGKKDVFTPSVDNRWSTFVAGSGEFTSIAGDGNAPGGYDLATGGFTLGATYRATEGFALGAFTGYAGTGVDLVDDGRLRVNSGKLGVYATLYGNGWYVNALAAGGLTSFDTQRKSLGGSARGETDGGEFSALLSGGYDFHFGTITAGPVAEAGYTWSGYEGFRENGSDAPLDLRGNQSDSLRSRVGARIGWNLGRARPELRLLWQHEWADNTRPVDAAFASGAARDFRVEGSREGGDALVVNASVSLLLSERVGAYLAYDGVLARERYDAHSVSAGVRVAF